MTVSISANTRPIVHDTGSIRYILFSQNDIISAKIIQNGEWESHLHTVLDHLIQNNHGDMLDIGANLGAIAIPFARRHPQSRVYCFEAQRQVYMQLCGNIILNGTMNVYPYHLAIGGPDDDGQMIDVPLLDFGTDPNIGALSLDDRVNDHTQMNYKVFEKVAVVSVDSLGLTNIGLVKIDIEGFELRALRGMTRMLRDNHFPAVCLEVWRESMFPWMAEERAAIQTLLTDLGYEVTILEKASLAIAQHPSRNTFSFSAD